MLTLPTRIALGFVSGALSHLIFQGALGTLYYHAGLIPALPWSLVLVPPLGVPMSASLAFWAGLWGILFGALQPGLGSRLGLLGSALAAALAALAGRWCIVLPLKGQPIAEGLDPTLMLVFIGFHLAFGIGLALIFSGFWSVLAKPSTVSESEHKIRAMEG
jgi:hypothetical protein